MNKRAYILIGAATVIVLAVGGFVAYRSAASVTFSQNQADSDSGSGTITPDRPVPADCGQVATTSTCVEYRNDQYDFSLFYPNTRDMKTYDEGGGAATIVFQNVDLVRGFQIFIVPYTQDQVTEDRFKEDEPSGVRENVQAMTVDGATAASFYSTDAALGDTYEVWFIHGGFLYEVTTLKDNADQLNKRLQTWQFD